MLVPQWVLVTHTPNNTGGIDEVGPRHNVGVEVIINDSGVLVGPGNPVDVELSTTVDTPEPKISPHSCGLDEDRCHVPEEEGLILGRPGVVHNRMDNIGIDVVLSSTRRVIS